MNRNLVFALSVCLTVICCDGKQDNPEPDISDGLIAYWNFDNDTPGIVKDASGNNIVGTPYSLTYEAGKIGQSVVFDQAGDKIAFPDYGQTPPTEIPALQVGSISIWFRFSSLGAQILPLLYFGESETGTTHNSLIVEIGHGGGTNPLNRKLYFTIINQSFCYDSSINLEENTWYHFVAVVSSSGNTGYLNGVEMTNRNYNLGSNSSYSDFFSDVPVRDLMSIGYGRYGQEDPFFSFNGSIDEVRIYNRNLLADEVLELYQMGQ